MSWVCTNDHTNADGVKFCKSCGEDSPATKPVKLTTGNGLPMWQGLPKYVKPNDDDVCGEWLEDGSLCQKTVREHIDEFRQITQKAGTVFTRPSRVTEVLSDEALEQRRQMLAQRADEAMKILKNLPPAAGAP